VICECRNPANARARAIKSLMAAQDGDGLFIVCRTSKILDAVHITRTFGFEPD
jgi:hypothetical protein